MKRSNKRPKTAFTNKSIIHVLYLFSMIIIALINNPFVIHSQSCLRDSKVNQGKLIAPLVLNELSFEKRLSLNKAIENVYFQHRIFPGTDQKPSFESLINEDFLRERVKDYLRKSNALKQLWQHPISREELQSEINRMAMKSSRPDMLREIWT